MDFFFSVVMSPAAIAAVFFAMYMIYPTPLLHGYKFFGGYLLAGLQRKFIQAGDFTYSFYDRSPSPRAEGGSRQQQSETVLFLHGFTGNKTMWMLLSRFLPKHWRLIAMDLPGHGESSFIPGYGYSAYDLGDRVNEFVEAMGLEDFHLVGISMGALVSLSYAARHGQKKLKTLSVMCPPGAHKLPGAGESKFFRVLSETGRNMVLPADAEQFQEMMALVLHNPSPYSFHHRMREALVAMQRPYYSHFREVFDDLQNSDASEEKIRALASQITTPLLIAWGDHDQVCHPSGAAQLAQEMPHADVVMFQNCGHAISMEMPKKSAKTLQDFICKHVKAERGEGGVVSAS